MHHWICRRRSRKWKRDFCIVRNGPRPIDMDILLYDSIEYHDEVLTIPHVAMQEREFVLRPLCE